MSYAFMAYGGAVGYVVQPHSAVFISFKNYKILPVGFYTAIKPFAGVSVQSENFPAADFFLYVYRPLTAAFAAEHLSRYILMRVQKRYGYTVAVQCTDYFAVQIFNFCSIYKIFHIAPFSWFSPYLPLRRI